MLPYIDPIRVYQVNGTVCTVDTACPILSVSNNQTVVAAVTGKKIRVMGLLATVGSGAGQAGVTLKNGSGGATRMAFVLPASTVGPIHLPLVNSGYFDTDTGVGLFVDIATSVVNLNLFYITYTPTP